MTMDPAVALELVVLAAELQAMTLGVDHPRRAEIIAALDTVRCPGPDGPMTVSGRVDRRPEAYEVVCDAAYQVATGQSWNVTTATVDSTTALFDAVRIIRPGAG